MRFLALVQRLRQEAGIPGTGPTTVVDQAGELRRLVDYVATAWSDIQAMHHNWKFLRKEFSFPVYTGKADYTPAGVNGPGPGNGAALADFRQWLTDTLRIYQASAGVADEGFLVECGYESFRDTYQYGLQVAGRPAVFSQRPRDSALLFGPSPDADYVCRGDYMTAPVLLTSDDDVPAIPAHLHMAIVWKALRDYALYESASEVLAKAESGLSPLLTALEFEQLPSMGLGHPLA